MVANTSEKLVKAHQMILTNFYNVKTLFSKLLSKIELICISLFRYSELPILDLGQENGVLK